LREPTDVLENLIGGLRPDERLGVGMMRVDKVANGCLLLRDTPVGATAQFACSSA
jgi:hypothetical protein